MKHLLDIESISADDITALLDRAQAIKDNPPTNNPLDGKILMTLFFEDSTRTRTSFVIAGKRLGAQMVNWNPKLSALSKNESFSDTVQTLAAMKPDCIIIRHKDYGSPGFVAGRVDCPVINAGDSWRAHPTQAILDALTIRQEKGRIEGLTVAICGDVAHSRVAACNMHLLTKMGAKVRIIAPDFLMPEKDPVTGLEKFTTLEEGLPGCDVVMMLRIQKERMDTAAIPDDATYHRQYGLTHERLKLAKSDAIVMHPGPMNRGVEIADDVADDPQRSVILKQVENGVYVRMAALEMLVNKA